VSVHPKFQLLDEAKQSSPFVFYGCCKNPLWESFFYQVAAAQMSYELKEGES
jgi:hypothetical protein